MNLSNMQEKDMVNIMDGKRLGRIIDIVIEEGKIVNMIIEENKGFFKFFRGSKEFEVKWEEIIKIGEDVILVELKHIIQ